jgi:hypothetical protein
MFARIAMHSTVDVSAFAALERSFVALSCDSSGLSYQDVPLVVVRDRLLYPDVSLSDQDAVWRFLVGRARAGCPRWVVGAAGMALPGLRHQARRLSASRPSLRADVEAELVSGFLHALARLDVRLPAVAARLITAARRAASQACAPLREVLDADPGRWVDTRPRGGHPDLLLVDAIAAGIIGEIDGRLLAATRLERQPDDEVAAALGMGLSALRSRRHRAARRLADAITSGRL